MTAKLIVRHDYITLRVTIGPVRVNMTSSYSGEKVSAAGVSSDDMRAVMSAFCAFTMAPHKGTLGERMEALRAALDPCKGVAEVVDTINSLARVAPEEHAAVRETLINRARELTSHLPQYAGHFDNYVLVQVNADLKTKMGTAFRRGEYSIARPKDQRGGAAVVIGETTRTVFSFLNNVDTVIPERHITTL